MKYPDGEGPVSRKAARARVDVLEAKRIHNVASALDKERTRNDDLTDPKHQSKEKPE